MHWYLNLAGLGLTTIAAAVMYFFPPVVTVYTAKRERVAVWVHNAGEEGERVAARQRWVSKAALVLLAFGFLLQFCSAFLSFPHVQEANRASPTVPTPPPAECATARNAKECFDILEKAGKNPFDAYGYVGAEPVYGGQGGAKVPPCKSGATRCKPWERDWGEGGVPPGTVVTDDGTIAEAPASKTAR